MRQLGIAMVILLLAAPLAAQGSIDWDADNVGFFFDVDATQTATTAAMGQSVRAYLVAFNLTFTAGIESWQGGCYWPCVMENDRWPDFVSFQPFMLTSPGNVTLEYMDCGYGQQPSGVFGVPATGPSVVLAYMDVIVLTLGPVGIYDEWGGVVVHLDDGSTVNLRNSTYPVSTMPPFLWLYATINSDYTPIEAETSTWGDVKTMFR